MSAPLAKISESELDINEDIIEIKQQESSSTSEEISVQDTIATDSHASRFLSSDQDESGSRSGKYSKRHLIDGGTLQLKIFKEIKNDNNCCDDYGVGGDGVGLSTLSTKATDIKQQQQSISTGKTVRHINLKFENLTYTVKVGILSRETKTILRDISGNFKSGELTAIIGPSGAGKSSLLNLLSGYTPKNYSGNIKVNDYPRNLKTFIPQSAYITQDAELQSHLTVAEAMYFAANLKMGSGETKATRKDRVKKILQAIGMYDTRHTMTGKLSGGQKKRLSVALELVSNPPILFLDEPTSGLDSVTSTQCISLLKKLSQEGRTIICTIHQPSALIFGMFDHLFAIAEGKCIYSGGVENMVSFLSELNLECPESYNPSDFLLEISTNDYGEQNHRLTEKIQNGSCELYRKTKQTINEIEVMSHVEKMMESGLMTPIKTPHLSSPFVSSFSPLLESSIATTTTTATTMTSNTLVDNSSSSSSSLKANSTVLYTASSKECNIKPKLPNIQIDPTRLCQIETRYSASFYQQLILLLMRTFLIIWRDKSLALMRITLHAIMGAFIGTLYFGIGNNAEHTLNNFRYIFFSIMFVMYTAFSSILLNFPLEFAVVSREHFNRWYSLRSYYVALTLADFPIQLICTMLFITISYFLTGQPLEIIRLALFLLMVVMAALVGQSIGLAVGASMNVMNAAIFGPFFISPFLAFSGFFVQIKDVSATMQWLFHISFLKYSLEGSTLAIFGYNRPKLICNDIFCLFIYPERFLKEICMDNSSYEFALCALFVIFLLLRILSFYIMSFRLRLFR